MKQRVQAVTAELEKAKQEETAINQKKRQAERQLAVNVDAHELASKNIIELKTTMNERQKKKQQKQK